MDQRAGDEAQWRHASDASSFSHSRTGAMHSAFAEENHVTRLSLRLHNHPPQILFAAPVDQGRGRGEVGFVAAGDGDEAA